MRKRLILHIKTKIIYCLSIFFLCGNYSIAQLSNQSGVNGVTTYVNPIQPGEHPDQTLLNVGSDFYSTGSSFHFTPYVPILHSTDLVHWEVIARVVPPNWAGLNSDAPAAGIWEGALAYFNNKYWVYFSNSNCCGQYFCNATNPAGPWSAPTAVTGSTVTGYDNSIFVDDDGTPYMLMKNGPSINLIQQISPTTGQLTGTLLNLNWVNSSGQYSWAEGPVMCKRNGIYYYFVAGNVTGGQYVLSSATLTADSTKWTRLGNFFSNATSPGGLTGPNHISQPVQIADGTWWCLSHSYDNSGWYGQGRLGLLHQVIWNANGVPQGVPPNTNPVAAPNLANTNNILLNLPKADLFTSSTLSLNWHFFNKAMSTNYSLTTTPGTLTLNPGTGTTHILQKDGGHYYSMVTKVTINASATGNQAGLRMTNGDDNLFATLYSGYNGGKKIGFAFNGSTTEVNNTIGNTVWLKIVRVLHSITGYYSSDGKTWTQVGGAIDISTLDAYSTTYDEWVGTSIGLYSTGISSNFDLYVYKDGFSLNPLAGYNNYYGVTTSTKTPGTVVTNSASGDWLMLGGVSMDFNGTPSSSIVVNAASASGTGSLQVWIDNIGGGGTQIATIPITSSGGANVWQNYTANINVIGQHDLYFKFIGAAGIFSLNTVSLQQNSCTTVVPSVTSPVIYCQGSSSVGLQATAGTGGTLNWYTTATGGTSSTTAPIPTTTTAGSTTYYVSQTIGCESPRASIVVTVNGLPVAPAVTTPVTYCQNGTATALTATGTALKWYTSATGGTGSTTAPTPSLTTAGTTNYYVSQTTNGCEGPRSTIAVTVNALPVITPYVQLNGNWLQQNTAQTCSGNTISLGPQPTVANGWTWTGPGNYTSTTRQISLSNLTTAQGGVYTATYTDANGCKAISSTTVTVNVLPTAPTVTSSVTYCQNGTAPALSATGTGLLWYTAATGGTGSSTAPTPSTTTTGTTGYYVSQTTTGCEGPRSMIAVTVNALPNAPTATSPIIYCQNGTATALTATGTGILWYTAATGGTGSTTAPIPSTAAAGTTSYYVSQTTNGCEGPRAAIAVTVNATPSAPTAITPVTYCQNTTATALTATGTALKWYTVSTGGTFSSTAPVPVTTTAGTTSYYVSQTVTGCEGSRATIAVTVNVLPSVPTATSPIIYCQNGTSTALTATGTGILWYTAATGGTGSLTAPVPVTTSSGTTNYYVSQTVTGCEGPRAMIAVTVNTTPITPTVTSSVTYCQNGTATQLTATGTGLKWYTSATGGTGSSTAPIPLTTTTGTTDYYVSQTNNGCESARSLIGVTINKCTTDCAGVVNGTAYLDSCNNCVGGTTGLTACSITTGTLAVTTGHGLLIYPQPFSFSTHIELTNGDLIEGYQVYSSNGSFVEEKDGLTSSNIELGENLSDGLYIVIIQSSKGILTTKIVKIK